VLAVLAAIAGVVHFACARTFKVAVRPAIRSISACSAGGEMLRSARAGAHRGRHVENGKTALEQLEAGKVSSRCCAPMPRCRAARRPC
jgi:hypothetical protein